MGFPLDAKGGGGSRTMMCCPPMAPHSGAAGCVVISFPYEMPFYEVIGLCVFSSLPLVGFCWTGESQESLVYICGLAGELGLSLESICSSKLSFL